MEFNEIRHLLSCTRKAVDDYKMIEQGDRIAVGISGGKDSLALLCALHDLKRFYPKTFELSAVTISMGFKDMDFSPVEKFCRELGIEYKIVNTDLANVIFGQRKEENPCSLCAKMRRGMLHDAAKEMGCNIIALGHHYDDVIETFMLNLFHEGRIGAFLPVTYLSRKDITLIRPLFYATEKNIEDFISKNNLPLVISKCPADKNTERQRMKELVISLEKEYSGLRSKIFTAIRKCGAFEQKD